MILIKRCKVLCQIINIICKDGRIVFRSGSFDNTWILIDSQLQSTFMLIDFKILLKIHRYTSIIAEYRLNPGVGVLNKRTCMTVKIDTLGGVEKHVLFGIDL